MVVVFQGRLSHNETREPIMNDCATALVPSIRYECLHYESVKDFPDLTQNLALQFLHITNRVPNIEDEGDS